MNEQQEFAKRINDLTELALDQENVIFEDQLYDIFPEVKEDEAKLAVIKDYLTEKKIGINEKISFEEYMSDDEKNYLNFYLDDLKELKELTKGEREAFMLSAMAGSEDAQLVIMNDTLKNVVEIAKLYVGQGVLIEDLIGEGNIELVTAVTMLGACENAKEAEGMLASRIMNAMQDLIAADMDETSAEEKLLKKVNKVAEAAHELATDLGRKVTVVELSAESGISLNEIEKALKLTANNIEDIEVPDYLK